MCIGHGALTAEEQAKRNRQQRERTAKKRAGRVSCSHEGCTNVPITAGVCAKYGGRKLCSVEGCVGESRKGGLCYRHGPQWNLCSLEGCQNKKVKNGMCMRHGPRRSEEERALAASKKRAWLRARSKTCSQEGPTNLVKRTRICKRQDAKEK